MGRDPAALVDALYAALGRLTEFDLTTIDARILSAQQAVLVAQNQLELLVGLRQLAKQVVRAAGGAVPAFPIPLPVPDGWQPPAGGPGPPAPVNADDRPAPEPAPEPAAGPGPPAGPLPAEPPAPAAPLVPPDTPVRDRVGARRLLVAELLYDLPGRDAKQTDLADKLGCSYYQAGQAVFSHEWFRAIRFRPAIWQLTDAGAAAVIARRAANGCPPDTETADEQ